MPLCHESCRTAWCMIPGSVPCFPLLWHVAQEEEQRATVELAAEQQHYRTRVDQQLHVAQVREWNKEYNRNYLLRHKELLN